MRKMSYFSKIPTKEDVLLGQIEIGDQSIRILKFILTSLHSQAFKQVFAFMHLLYVYQPFFGQPNDFPNRYNVISLSFLLTLRYFVYFFDLVIFVNAIFIALEQNDGEIFFLAIFNLEIILKIYTYGFKRFFSHFWNM